MEENPFLRARKSSESASQSPQELNKQWWENLPMTYTEWEKDDRLPESFAKVEMAFLQSNPWIRRRFSFANWRGKKVLEIGCGSGAATILFAKVQANVVAIDITEMATKLTRMNALSQGLSVEVFNMDAEKTAFESGNFDFVFSWGVLHHSSKPQEAFKEVSRLLHSGGEGLIMVYNKNSLRYILKGLYWLIAKGKLFAGDSLETVQRYFTDGYYHRHYTPAELVTSLANVGLKTKKVSIDHMAKKMIPFIPKILDDFLKRTLGWLLIVEFVKK
ncbi:MAG: class I SAM-dependent methyltransferase [Candidatus Riflebacteria bacterium]|nr:class I SAM-dependent methyltransferase [Candidatus Riflebacteria bacterium]